MIHFEISHNAENSKRVPLRFLTSILLQNFKKIEGEPLESLKNFQKKFEK